MGSTIKDIAKDTNLSLATISKYINGKNILPENRKLIEESIERLGYTPNKTAQNLRSKNTKTICIFLPTIGDYFWGSLCNIIEEYMRQIDYSTIITSYNPYSDDNSSEMQFLSSKQVDGVIFVPHTKNVANLPSLLQKEKVPLVFLDQIVDGIITDFVTSDNQKAAYTATKYLLDHGHTTLGIITGDLSTYTANERLTGFQEACGAYHIPENNRYIYDGKFSSQCSAECFQQMMKNEPSPTAVLICGYNMTLGAILTLNALGLQIPNDFSLISFDDDEIFSAFEPPITTVTQNLTEIAEQASQLLIKRIDRNYDTFPETRKIETNLLIRKSVMAPKT
jgi:Transcriptional regulators